MTLKRTIYNNRNGGWLLIFIYYYLILERKPAAIPVEDFPDHVAQLHADSDYLFSEEFHVSAEVVFPVSYLL